MRQYERPDGARKCTPAVPGATADNGDFPFFASGYRSFFLRQGRLLTAETFSFFQLLTKHKQQGPLSSLPCPLCFSLTPQRKKSWTPQGFGGLPARRGLCTPALAHAPSLDTARTRSARAPTSPRSTGFCAIWNCISSSSISRINLSVRHAFILLLIGQ